MGTDPNKMKLLLGLLGVSLGFESELIRSKRSAAQQCAEWRSNCQWDVDDGMYTDMASCMSDVDPSGLCSGAGTGDGEDDNQCQAYTYEGKTGCCPENMDVAYYWPEDRQVLSAKGPRPLAPKETCPNGCDVATDVDQFACAYYTRVSELNKVFAELEEFLDSDLKSIIDFKTKFVRRYNEVKVNSVRSAKKMQKIRSVIMEIVGVVQENEQLIAELEGEIANVNLKIEKINLDLTNLHQFCKVGKQCAKQCFFGPELFGGIKTDCAEYYHNSFWKRSDNPSHWQGMPQSGVYIIQPSPSLAPKYAYCDQKTDGGGWTLLQHKGISNESLWEQYDAPIDDDQNPNKYRANWNQPMSAYKNGFGWVSCNGESDYWMGLDYMSALTYRAKSGPVRLRVDIKDWEGKDFWGYYDKFAIRDARRSYQMTAGSYSGVGSYSIGDAWGGVGWDGEDRNMFYTRSSGMKFSTKDVDNDRFCFVQKKVRNNYGVEMPVFNKDDVASGCGKAAEANPQAWQTSREFKEWSSCAGQDGAGFWYNRCSAGNLNGHVYYKGAYNLKELRVDSLHGEPVMRDHDDGMIWGTLNRGRDYAFMLSEMRVRPRNFRTAHVYETRRNGGELDEERKN